MKLCECGCGQPTIPARQSDSQKGLIRGVPQRYLRFHKERHVKAKRLQRTHCRHGHELPTVGRLDCPTCHSVWMKRRRRERYAEATAYERKMARKYALRSFGMTVADYEVMAAKQAGRCAICQRFPVPVRGTARLHVDHDHETGHVRGLLCSLCNLALGKLGDSPERLRAAAAYLETARTPFQLKAV